MYFLAFVAVNVISVLLWFVRTKRKTNLYYSGYLTAMSLGLLAFTLDPTPIQHAAETILLHELIARFCSAVSYRFSPYFLLLAALSILNWRHPKKFVLLAWFTAFPVLCGFLYDAIAPQQSFYYIYLDYRNSFWLLSLWGSAYILLANFLLCYSAITEKESNAKQQKILIAVLTLPTIFVTYHAYIVPITGSHDFTFFTAQLGLFVFLAVLFFTIRYGFMGIRLVIGKDFLENSIKSIALGTSMMNHAIKNEIQVIESCLSMIDAESNKDSNRYFSIISNSTKRLKEIVSHIHENTQDLYLNYAYWDLSAIIEAALKSQEVLLKKKQINVIRNYHVQPCILCDSMHLQGALANLIRNSVEAMEDRGRLTVEIDQIRNTIRLKIIDNGSGISMENVPRVFQPFFTTKQSGTHYGLGLPYCFKVIQEHKGTIEINSKVGEGTTVVLTFPCNIIP